MTEELSEIQNVYSLSLSVSSVLSFYVYFFPSLSSELLKINIYIPLHCFITVALYLLPSTLPEGKVHISQRGVVSYNIYTT